MAEMLDTGGDGHPRAPNMPHNLPNESPIHIHPMHLQGSRSYPAGAWKPRDTNYNQLNASQSRPLHSTRLAHINPAIHITQTADHPSRYSISTALPAPP